MGESQTFQEIVSQIIVHPEKLIYVCSQDEIFADLQATQRKIETVRGNAEKGDFVLCRLTGRDGVEEKSLCIGKRVDHKLDEIVQGHKAGDRLELEHEGVPLLVEILHVKRPVQFDVECGDFEKLNIKGVRTRKDYTESYIENHRNELAQKAVSRIYKGIERQYLKIALKSKEIPSDEVLTDYAKRAKDNQLKMLKNYFKGNQELLDQTLEKNFHKGSQRDNEEAFEKSTKEAYLLGIVAEDVMTEMGYEIAVEEYETNIKASIDAFHMSEAECRECLTMEDYRMSCFTRGFQQLLFDEFVKQVQIKIG